MIRNMRKLWLLIIGVLLLVLTGSATQSEAMGPRVSVGVDLPAYRFAAPPEVVVIPGTYVYMVPDANVDMLFFQGYWWRPYEGRWYRSQDYNGRWDYIEPRSIPYGLRELPQDYRHRLSPRYERIPYRDVQRNWEKWEKEKYWDRRGEQDRGGYGDQVRGGQGEQNRRGQGEQDRGGQGDQGHGGYGEQNRGGHGD
jgi:hypothetical protein